MIEEQDLKTKHIFLVDQLYDLAGLADNMSGNLECLIYIKKHQPKTSRKIIKTLEKNLGLIDEISEALKPLIHKSEEISFAYVKPEPEKKKAAEEKYQPPNNIIIFPLGQEDDDIYVPAGQTIFDNLNNDDEK